MNNNEKKIVEEVTKQLIVQYPTTVIPSKADIYFSLKQYCIEGLILLNKARREMILNKIEKNVVKEYNKLNKVKISNKDSVKSWTLGSCYDNNSVVVIVNDLHYRLSAKQIPELLRDKTFKTIRKRKHTYLELIK